MDRFSRNYCAGKIDLFYQIIVMLPVNKSEEFCLRDYTHGRCIGDTGIVMDENKAAVKVPLLIRDQSHRTVKIYHISKVVTVRICNNEKGICRFVAGNNWYDS